MFTMQNMVTRIGKTIRPHLVPLSILAFVELIIFRFILFGKTSSAVASHSTSIWPWRAYPYEKPEFLVPTDQADSYYPWSVHVSRSIRDGYLAFWNPDSFGGAPFSSNGQSGAFYPFRLIFSLVVGPAALHDLMILFHLFITGVGMYFLMKKFKASTLACTATALFAMFSPMMFAWMQFEFLLVITAWLPFCVIMVIRIVDDDRRIQSLTLFAVLSYLIISGSNLQFAAIAFVPVFIYLTLGLLFRSNDQALAKLSWAKSTLKKMKCNVRSTTIWTSLAALSTITISAIVLLPTLILSQDVGRDPVPYDFLTSPDVRMPFSYLLRNTAWHPKLPYSALTGSQMTFVGIFVTFFAIVGLFSRSRGSAFARTIAICTGLFALGTPIVWFFYTFVPGIEYLQRLGRSLFLWSFALSILAGFGIDISVRLTKKFIAKINSNKLRRLGNFAVLIGICASIGLNVIQTSRYGLLIAPTPFPRVAKNIFPETPAITAMKKNMGPDDRILPIRRGDMDWTPPTMYASHHMVHNISSGAGYESVVPENIVETWQIVSGVDEKTALDLTFSDSFIPSYLPALIRWDLLIPSGITILYVPPDIEEEKDWDEGAEKAGLTLKKIYSGIDGKLYRIANKGSQLFSAADQDSTKEEAREGYFKSGEFAIYSDEQIPSVSSSIINESEKVKRINTNNPNSVDYTIETSGSRWLYIPVSYDKGWSAEINGSPTKIYRANYSFMAIKVPEGNSEVKLNYVPEGLYIGAALSTATFAVLIGASIISRKRRISARTKNCTTEANLS